MRRGTLPPPYRGLGNSAAAHSSPGAARPSAPHESKQCPSSGAAPGIEERQRSDFERSRGAAGPCEIARGFDRLIEGRALDHIEAKELLLGLGERPVENEGL